MECIILSVKDTYMDAQEVMHMTDYSKITALYSRLSVGDEDRDGGESNSIQNQKIFLEDYARGLHLTNIRHYIDDDESGRFFDRSAYSRMMDDVENGKIGVCIMKDLTRWGRDYLQVGNATTITGIRCMDSLLIGVQNNFKDGSTDWSSRIIVSQSNFNSLSGANISVASGSFTVYYDSSMEYKLNAFSADSSLFYNPTTKQEFFLIQDEPVCRDGLLNTRSVFFSFLILNDEDYNILSASLGNKYRAVSYMVNVEDWQHTENFQNDILQAVISDNSGQIFTNWHNSAAFAKTGSQAEYLQYNGNETRIARVWSLYPLSKLSNTTTQFEAFATYLMLMLFIAIVAFVSAVMVIGLKLISTIWDDAAVYENLRRLGMKQNKIKERITKQMVFVYFIPPVLGCLIGAFTTYRIILVSSVIYIGETMQLVGCVCGLVLVIQVVILFGLRSKVVHSYI